jgi:tetratricopeptide (TPR) repeat protein
LEQGFMMASQGRCYHARAGKLDQSLDYAAQARETGEVLNDTRLRAWCAMEAEPYLYQGKWDEVVRVVEGALPIAGEIREWNIVIHSSAWLAIAYLKLRLPADARQALERGLKAVPARSVGQYAYSIAFAQIALAQSHLAAGDTGEALIAAHRALGASEKGRFGLEEGAAHRVLGQIHEALDARAEADAAFRRSLEVWDEIQSRPELAQTLLAYGRFRRGDNTVENRALIERALHLFEDMNATGWIEEARAALAAA